MQKNIILSNILEFLQNLKMDNFEDHLFFDDKSIVLKVRNRNLLKITSSSLILAGKINLTDKVAIQNKKIKNNTSKIKAFYTFYHEISGSIKRINHFGIGYHCDDSHKEIEKYKKALKKSSFNLYEEDSLDENVRWLFVGDATKKKSPLFEITLSSYPSDPENNWLPHFQLDFDTNLTFKQLKKVATRHLGRDFFLWQLDIPNYGVALVMGLLGNIQATKIWVGFGTNLRLGLNRENIFKKL